MVEPQPVMITGAAHKSLIAQDERVADGGTPSRSGRRSVATPGAPDPHDLRQPDSSPPVGGRKPIAVKAKTQRIGMLTAVAPELTASTSWSRMLWPCALPCSFGQPRRGRPGPARRGPVRRRGARTRCPAAAPPRQAESIAKPGSTSRRHPSRATRPPGDRRPRTDRRDSTAAHHPVGQHIETRCHPRDEVSSAPLPQPDHRGLRRGAGCVRRRCPGRRGVPGRPARRHALRRSRRWPR